MKKTVLGIIGWTLSVFLFIVWAEHNREARALSNREGKKGLFADLSIIIDGVTVRRFRDVEAGTICYVASAPIEGCHMPFVQPAISCVGWQP